MERKRVLLALTWIVVSLAAVTAQDQARTGNRVTLQARPFPLTAVRLLDSLFRDAMLRDQAYLLELDQDRLLHTFRLTAGLPTAATPLGGWEAPDVELRGHTAGHYLSAVALMYAATGDARFKQRGDALVAELAKIQVALAAKGYNPGYLSAFPEDLIDRVEARQRVWAPYYTLHKMLAGLLDMHVNLFIPSELTWKAQGLIVRQTTRFPEEGRSQLAFTADRPVRLTVRVRHPFWATSGFGLSVNGVPQPTSSTPGSDLSIVREWATGDTMDISLPMSLRTEALPGTTDTVALLYGPILLAGELGVAGLDAAKRYGPSAPPLSKVSAVEVPALVTPDTGRLLASIVPTPDRPLTFRTAGIGQPRDVTLVPFYRADQTRYTVYWKMYSPSNWETRKATSAAPHVSPRVVDSVDLDTPASEQAHAFRGEKTTQPEFEGRIGRETRDGWFSYELEVTPDRPVALAAMYRGSEGRRRVFDVLVDGVTIASETLAYHPTEWIEKVYPVPEAVTRGKRRVTVRFQPASDALTASVFEVRVVERPATP